MNRLLKFTLIASFILVVFSCSDDFLERPPEDSFNTDDFYRNNEEVESATIALYLRPWYLFVSEAAWPIGELASGNAFTYDGRNTDFINFSVNSNHENIEKAWNSLYTVVAQSNAVINTLPTAVSSEVDPEVVNNALGEAHLIRAVAYFYLVRIFGSIPIIANNTEAVLELELPRNPVVDVYRFMIEDLEFAIANCYDTPRSAASYTENARVTSGSAKAMLAKVYLYQQNYTEAYRLADEVITAGSFRLFGGDAEDGDPDGSYYGLFQLENDNNPESIFSLQWGTSGNYAEGNSIQSQFAQPGVTGFADGWGSVGPSVDLQLAYENQNTDTRFYSTIQTEGAFYPDINGGFTVDEIDNQDMRAAIKKYVIGGGAGTEQNYPNNTYIMRYGELLLIHAEAAIMGGGDLTAGTASFNKIRRRAGLPEIANPTIDDVFNERRIELAFEFEFWYDVVRRGETFAVEFLSNSERGVFSDDDPPVIWSQNYEATAEDLLFPYPITEIQSNPGLSQDPVPYNFGD